MGIKYDSDDFPIYKTEISSEEYRSLTDTNVRTSILRTEIISVLEKQLAWQSESTNPEAFSVKDAQIDVETVCKILGFYPTFNGFLEKEKQRKEMREIEKREG